MDKQGLTSWPQVRHTNAAWIAAYTHGWTEAASTFTKDLSQINDDRLGWAVFCARYAWPHWPIAARLDDLYEQAPALADAPLPWLEWELYLLSGDGVRLAQRFARLQQWTNDVLLQVTANAGVQQVISLQSLAWIANELDRGEEATTRRRQAREISASLLPAVQVDRELALLWADHPSARTDKTVTLVRQSLAGATIDSEEQASWIKRCHLLLALLRHHQEIEWAATVATMAMEACLPHPGLAWTIPPLFIDGIVGCVPQASEGFLSWWLSQPPPIGVTHYPLGENWLSLHATQGAGAGTLLAIHCSAPLLLEVVTPQRSYTEALAAGRHRLTLTVLDRTNVKGS